MVHAHDTSMGGGGEEGGGGGGLGGEGGGKGGCGGEGGDGGGLGGGGGGGGKGGEGGEGGGRPRTELIHVPKLDTRVYTPGALLAAQPCPQLTTPTTVGWASGCDGAAGMNSGPPESPAHESFWPPGMWPAHIIPLVIE